MVATPWLRGEAGHARGLTQVSQRLLLTLPCAQGALDSGYSPDVPLVFSPDVTYITLRWAFWRMLRHRIRNKGEGGAWRYGGRGHGRGIPWRESPCTPSPKKLGRGI